LDTYLERDWLAERLPARPRLAQKIKVLSRRPILQLPEVLLSEFVAEPRHNIIHRYETRTPSDARIVLEAASSIIVSLKALSDPERGRVFAGTFLRKAEGRRAVLVSPEIAGFGYPESNSFGLTWRDADRVVRAGVGIISDKGEVEVWWAPIKEFAEEQHFRLLEWWDSLDPYAASLYTDPRELFLRAGLDAP